MRRTWLVAAALIANGAAAHAQDSCGGYNFADRFAEAFISGEPIADAGTAAERIVTLPDAVCHQDRAVARLQETFGPPIGYKAAATSPGAQKQLELDEPVFGIFLDGMIRDNGAVIPIESGARLIYELDLIAVVGSDTLNDAETQEEALAAIESFAPFIEVADLMVPQGSRMTGPLAQAVNAGARTGVIGSPVSARGLTVDSLAEVAGTLLKDGTEVTAAPATALLGHPLNSVLWLVKAAERRGITLKEGDLLSLGSMGTFERASPGEVVAIYEGLGPDSATVTLTLE